MSPLVSVIICTFNRKNLVNRAIESVLNQNGVRLEIIVVDDASDDGTSLYLKKKYGHQIKLCRLENNVGVAKATNYGYECSQGDFIALLGDDDYWSDKGKLTKQLEVIKHDENLGFVGSWRTIRYPERDTEDRFIPPHSRRALVSRVLSGGCIGGSTPLIRRAVWDYVGGMDPQQVKGTDSDLFRRIILSGYSMDVLREFVVVSDKSHGLERMTPVQTRQQAKKALAVHWHVIKKYYLSYFCYPIALAVRLRRMSKLALYCATKR